jgi:RHS repeat-associated protein
LYFKNAGDDYGYDKNGNLITDLNKKIGSSTGEDLQTGGAIQYNHLNLPHTITVKDDVNPAIPKGTITYIYDATGNKLEKRVHENASSSNNNTVRDIVTSYVSGFNYETKTLSPVDPASANYEDKLQFFAHEEGRVRVDYSFTDNPLFHYDYFIKDHLGNVRMVLTEEQQATGYVATMETDARLREEKSFSNISNTAFPAVNVPGGYPADGSSINHVVSKLNGSGNKIGPSLVLKVMSGDKLLISTRAFYRPQGVVDPPSNILGDVLTTLANGIVGNIGELKGTVAALSNTSTSPMASAMTTFLQNSPTPSDKPKAYLNYVFLDEQFNVLPNSGSVHAGNPDILNIKAKGNLIVPKNGFVYIYVSNETPNWDVFFDNLLVTHTRGALLEETHYYPFGLTMAGISSRALAVGGVENNRKFNKGSELQNKEFTDGSGLEWYATHLRSLDPQLGRWWQQDSKPDYAQSLYSSMGNNPISFNDPFGDTTNPVTNFIRWIGSVLTQNDQVRKGYNKEKQSLAEKPATQENIEARDRLRKKYQAKTPQPVKSLIYKVRPPEAEAGRPKTNPGGGNKTATKTASAGGFIGKALLAYGIFQSGKEIINSNDPITEVGRQGSIWTGTISGGTIGAEYGGSLFGLPGAVVGGIVGSIAGGILGDKLNNSMNGPKSNDKVKQDLKKMFPGNEEVIDCDCD